jgi:hypothetical protein
MLHRATAFCIIAKTCRQDVRLPARVPVTGRRSHHANFAQRRTVAEPRPTPRRRAAQRAVATPKPHKSGNRLNRLNAVPPSPDGERGKMANCASFSFCTGSTG